MPFQLPGFLAVTGNGLLLLTSRPCKWKEERGGLPNFANASDEKIRRKGRKAYRSRSKWHNCPHFLFRTLVNVEVPVEGQILRHREDPHNREVTVNTAP